MSEKITLTLECIEQADVLVAALDLYTRLGIGQLEMVEELFRMDGIPASRPVSFDERMAMADALRDLMNAAKQTIGFPRGGSLGIGGTLVPIGAQRAYEMQKVLAKALAEYREPKPGFRGVNYDGLILRYTHDPVPTATVIPQIPA